MKRNIVPAAAAMTCVFALAGMLYVNQRRAQKVLRLERESLGRQVDSVRRQRFEPPQPPAPAAIAEAPASESRGPGSGESRLVERIMGALEQRGEALETAGDAAAAEFWSERLGILLDLSPEESSTARTRFHELMVEARRASVQPDLDELSRQQAFADLERRLDEFLAARFGPDKAALFRVAEQARQEATIEHQANRALAEVSEVIDLPPGQKDALYTAFAAKARAGTGMFQPGQTKPQFTHSFQEGPRVNKPLDIARSHLTPDQIALYQKAQASESKGQQRAMQAALEVMRGVFDEALGR